MLWHFHLCVCLCVTHCFVSKRLNVLLKFFYYLIAPSIILFFVTEGRCLTPMTSPLTEMPSTGWENLTIFWAISWYILERVWDTAICYRSDIGNHTQSIEWWHFRWLSDPNPSFKVTLQFKVEYVANVACYGHSYHRTQIGSYTRAT